MSGTSSLVLEAFLAYRTAKLAAKLSEAFSVVYQQRFGLTIAQWRVLATLAHCREASAKSIANTTSMDKVKVSRAVQLLAERELLTKRIDANDKRSQKLRLTDSGRHLYAQIEPLALQWQNQITADLSQEELTLFMKVVDKLEHGLKENT